MTHPWLVFVNQITHFSFRQRISIEYTGACYSSFNVYIVMFLHICCRLCNCRFVYVLYCKLTICKKRLSFLPLWTQRSFSSDWGILPTPFIAIYNAPELTKIKGAFLSYLNDCLIRLIFYSVSKDFCEEVQKDQKNENPNSHVLRKIRCCGSSVI